MITEPRRQRLSCFPARSRKVATLSQTAPHPWQFWLLAAGIPLCLCAGRLNCDLWYDEAYTIIHFVSQPWHRIIRDYSAPNNHIFYSLLLRPLFLLSSEEFVLRLPGFFFAAGTLWFTFQAGALCGGTLPGCLATLWLGMTQMFVIHVMEIRGYSLSLFLTTVLGYLALAITKYPSQKKLLPSLAGFICSALLVYTIPTNLLFGISLAGFLAIREWDPKARWFGLRKFWWWFAGLGVGCALYLPVWEQLHATAAQGAGWNWRASSEITWAFFRAALADWWPILGLGIVAQLASFAFGKPKTTRKDRFAEKDPKNLGLISLPNQLGWLVAGLLSPFLLAGLLGIHPFVRNFIPALHFLAVGCGALLAIAYTKLSRSIMGLWAARRRPHPPELSRGENLSEAPESYCSGNDLNQGVINPRAVSEILLAQLVLLVFVLPRFWTYADRLEKRRQLEPVQDGYYNYYAAHFRPSEAVRIVADCVRGMAPKRSYRVLFPQADFYPLAYYLAKEGISQEEIVPNCPEEHVFLILPAHLSVADFLREYGGDPRTAENFQLLKDPGYYRVFWAVGAPSRASEPGEQSPSLRHVASAESRLRHRGT